MFDPNDQSLLEIQADIAYARKWALEHFNVDAERSTLLDPPTYLVEFPAPDEMRASPKFYGRSMDIWFTYKLAWVDGGMVWTTSNLLTGQKLPGLKVPMKRVIEK